MAQPINTYIGSGMSFPILLDGGKPVISNIDEHVEASIRNILIWPLNSGYFNKDFGSRLTELLEEPNVLTLKVMVKEFIKQAINKWEKRIRDLSVKTEISTPESIQVTISYKINLTNTTQTISQNIIL